MMKSLSTKTILLILQIISWVIFVGLCIEAGGFIVNTVVTMLLAPENAQRFWQQVDLSALYRYDHGHFLVLTMVICIVAVLKALLFYLIITVFYNKAFRLSKPFGVAAERFVIKIAYLVLVIGLFSKCGADFAAWLEGKDVNLPGLERLGLEGAEVWLFMSVILFVVAQVFKKGTELQSENELTV